MLAGMLGTGGMAPRLPARSAARPAVNDRMLRDQFWSRFGSVIDAFDVEPFNPFFADYPHWPGSVQRFRLLDTRGGTRIAFTDGLSDPAGSDLRYLGRNGLELELYLETDDQVGSVNQGWAVNLLLALARLAVNDGALGARLKQERYLTVQLDMGSAPEAWSLPHKDGNIGIFLGLPNPEFPARVALSESGFTPVNVKLMRPEELQYALDHGPAGREHLALLYASVAGAERLSNLDRPSVV